MKNKGIFVSLLSKTLIPMLVSALYELVSKQRCREQATIRYNAIHSSPCKYITWALFPTLRKLENKLRRQNIVPAYNSILWTLFPTLRKLESKQLRHNAILSSHYTFILWTLLLTKFASYCKLRRQNTIPSSLSGAVLDPARVREYATTTT